MSKLIIDSVNLRFWLRNGQAVSALDDISLTVADREFAVIVGPSGCGKSSLLRMVAGLQRPTEGKITIDNKEISVPGQDRGMVFQSYTLFPWLTVLKNVEFGPKLAGLPARECEERANAYLKLVGLEAFRSAYPRQLSGGMMQRVAIARALANNPDILLMDEPFGALDAQTRTLMQELLLSIWQETHKTVLFVTHDIDEAVLLGDRVYVMTAQPGRIKDEVTIELPRPRSIDTLTSPEFLDYRRRIDGLIRDEARKSLDH